MIHVFFRHSLQKQSKSEAHKPQSTSCSLGQLTKKTGTSSSPKKLRYRRSYGVLRKKKRFTSSYPQTSRSEVFSQWNAEEGEVTLLVTDNSQPTHQQNQHDTVVHCTASQIIRRTGFFFHRARIKPVRLCFRLALYQW